MNKITSTSPTDDPEKVYPRVPGIDYKYFKLSPEGVPEAWRKIALQQLHEYELAQKQHFLGYQTNQKLNFDEELHQYLNYHLNNVGDPFQSGNLTLNSKFIERAVLDYFASLWNAQWPHNNNKNTPYEERKDSYWGYVLTMGASEGNVYALWNARDYLSGKFLMTDAEVEHKAKEASKCGRKVSIEPRTMYYQAIAPECNPNKYTPVAFYSQDTHYSIIKFMRVLNIQTFYEIAVNNKLKCPLEKDDYPDDFSNEYIDEISGWPLEVPSDKDGNIHIPALVKLVDFFAEKGYPPLISFNYGTTFKGAYDRVKDAVEKLVPVFKNRNLYERKVHYDPNDKSKFDVRNGFWIHVDGALGAGYMPFIEMAIKQNKIKLPDGYTFPEFDFRIKELHSLVFSGHKWLGAPWPTGIFMSKVKYQLQPPDDPQYIGSPDTTFAGSRNGFSPIILWNSLSKNSYDSLIEMAVNMEGLAEYAFQEFKKLEQKLGIDLWVERSPLSLTIRFKKPDDHIVFKYSLSEEELYVDGKRRKYCHMYIMGHVTEKLIDEFILELSKPYVIPDQEEQVEQVVKCDIKPNATKLLHVPYIGRGFK
ncbi:histidine decarboxylase [Heliobacillus mobilis]|uniref:Histidine decarboxylase n=1 Tax=Heliobacterium mobile TaxID=28064 RepID=A0A6I3SGI0_HELMO|nr:pyridoxal-dependent decarboxylase [Heliobacterium mobile]MTV47934.1 histidine decarboxylase [Heliobacterium mobile]